MSVPNFRNSKSKVRRRRSHHALKPVNVVIDKKTGEPRLPHHVAPSTQVKVKTTDKLAKEVVKEMKKMEEKGVPVAEVKEKKKDESES